jgi:hypothetical protein
MKPALRMPGETRMPLAVVASPLAPGALARRACSTLVASRSISAAEAAWPGRGDIDAVSVAAMHNTIPRSRIHLGLVSSLSPRNSI